MAAQTQSLKRREDWPEKLAEFFAGEARVQTFAAGTHNCALFVCDAVLAMTDVDIACGLRGGNVSSTAAMLKKVAKKLSLPSDSDLETIASAVAEKFAMKEVPVLMAQRGDVVAFKTSLGATLGIVGTNGHKIAAVSVMGFVEIDIANAHRAWRVG